MRAATLSIIAHTCVLWMSPASSGKAFVAHVPDALVVVDLGRVQQPARPINAEMPRSVDKAPPPVTSAGDAVDRETSSVAALASLAIDDSPEYVGSAVLDKRPLPLTTLAFPYPEVAAGNDQGTLELTLYVSRQGGVDDIRIDFASVDQRIVDLAVEALRATPFSPGEQGGQAVAARLRLAIDYALGLP